MDDYKREYERMQKTLVVAAIFGPALLALMALVAGIAALIVWLIR